MPENRIITKKHQGLSGRTEFLNQRSHKAHKPRALTAEDFSLSTLLVETVPAIAEMIEPSPGFSIGSDQQHPVEYVMPAKLLQVKQHRSTCNAIYSVGELSVEVEYKLLKSLNAVRIAGKMTNQKTKPVRVHNVRSLAFKLRLPKKDKSRAIMHSLSAGVGGHSYPTPSFSFSSHELITSPRGIGCLVDIHSGRGGYSTNKDLPYSVVQVDDIGGIFWALEWPGSWWGCANRLADQDAIWIEAGPVASIEDWLQKDEWDIMLESGESLPLPPAIVGCYQGDYIDGCNSVRRLIQNARDRLGEKAHCPTNYNSFFTLQTGSNHINMTAQADVCEKAGIEYVVNDAGWYKGSTDSGWIFMLGTGNWRQEHLGKYPDGLRGLSEYVRQRGMEFGYWVGLENCHEDSHLAKEHSDWVIPTEPGMPSMVGHNCCIVDLGKSDAVQWFKDTIDMNISEFNVGWLKWDLNIYPEPLWSKADMNKPARRGITQIRHLEGMLEIWDHILSKHPDVVIEACCGGGRRMDLACLMRSHTYWCNDETRRPELQLYENIGANYFIPATYLNRMICYEGRSKPYEDWFYHALMLGTPGLAEDLSKWHADDIALARKHFEVYKGIRDLLKGDYYAIFGQPSTLDHWIGCQFHQLEKNQGLLFFFRRRSDKSCVQACLRWLELNAEYEFVDPYTEETQICSGRVLTDRGLEVNLPIDGSCILRYRKQ